ncbi:hypothetical protein CYY_001965 [Polysphondylium violaceum]|uniref:Importin N-terminal domain-containing protein n=1 Tax=Polysphondylium violaceum TaxID=133409 RepID=A0A8J4V3B8_9MYCE|nr:hypothetical protein CYY_001965 [Polysphondylium violaceum]
MDNLGVATITAFKGTLDPNDQVRTLAESQLTELKKIPGYAKTLVQILASNEIELPIRQAGAIFLKNMVFKSWKFAEKDQEMNQQDKEFVRENAMELLVHSHQLIQNQIERIIEIIAHDEFPATWTTLLPKAVEYLGNSNSKVIIAGLTSLQLAVKKYQYIMDKDRRKPLYAITEQIFPLLLQCIQALGNIQTPESAMMQKKIVKIYLYTTKFEMPEYIVRPDVINAWLSQFVRIIQREITPEENVMDEADFRRNHWWLLKKTTARVLNSLLRKAGKVRSSDPETTLALNKIFMPTYSTEIMKIFFDILSTRHQKYQFFYERYLQQLIEYFTNSINYGVTFAFMKPIANKFFQEIIFPIVCFTEKDQELWEDDPNEYLRSQFDTGLKDFTSARLECVNFTIDLVGKRGRENLDNVMAFCISLLMKYNNAPADQKNASEKEGVFIIIGILGNYLKGIKFYRDNLEQMLLLHVFPELTSQHGFLRARACQVFSEFYNIKFSDNANFSNALRIILGLMSDKDLPVRAKAGMSICNLVRAKQGTDDLRPVLPQLLEKIFTLLGEVESEDLIISLESIVNRFKTDIAPYAVTLASKLSEQFFRLLELEKDDTNSSMASQECLMVYTALLRALKGIPDIFIQLEPVLVPLLQKILTPDHLMYIEDGLRILSFMTFYPKTISPLIWSLFPQIMAVFDECGCDLISAFVNPLDNYISYGTEFLLSNPQYVNALVLMYKKMVDDINQEAADSADACKIIESLIQRAKGRIDSIISTLMESAIKRLLNTSKENNMSREFAIYLIELVANCIFYNPTIAIGYMEANNLIQPVFELWFKKTKDFQRFYDKKICVIAFSSILTMNPTPAFAKHGANVIISMMMHFTKDMLSIEKDLDKMERQREEDIKSGKIKEDEDETEEDQDDGMGFDTDYIDYDNDIEFDTVADNEDCPSTEDDEVFLDELEGVNKYYEEGNGDFKLAEGEEDEFEFEGDDDLGDDELFIDDEIPEFETPIDEVDGFELMISSLQQFFQLNPASQSVLTEKQTLKLQKYIALVPVRRAKLEQEKLKEEQKKK